MEKFFEAVKSDIEWRTDLKQKIILENKQTNTKGIWVKWENRMAV